MSGRKVVLEALGPSEPLDRQSHWWPALGIATLNQDPYGPGVYLRDKSRPPHPDEYVGDPWFGGSEEWESDGIRLGARRKDLVKHGPVRRDAHTDAFPSGLVAHYSEAGWVVGLEGGKEIASHQYFMTQHWESHFKVGEVPASYGSFGSRAPAAEGWSYPDEHCAVLMAELFQALDEAAAK